MSLIDEKVWIQYQTKIKRKQRRLIAALTFVLVLVALGMTISWGLVGLALFLVILLLIIFGPYLGLLGISYYKHNLNKPGMPWRPVYIPQKAAGLKEKGKILRVIRTSPPSSLLDLEVLMSVAGVQDREIIIELVQDVILLGQIDYEHNKLIPRNPLLSETHQGREPRKPEVSDALPLRQQIREQTLRIAQLEEKVKVLEGTRTSHPSQEAYECSICRQVIMEGEPVWSDSEFYVFHSPHIKEWIRVNATHPITKVKMLPDLEIYEPNAVLINGKLMNLDQAEKQGLL